MQNYAVLYNNFFSICVKYPLKPYGKYVNKDKKTYLVWKSFPVWQEIRQFFAQ